MPYSPGSFTREISWGEGHGLRVLHDAITAGFEQRLSRVPISSWREKSGIDNQNQNLLPPRFFLLNDRQQLVPDELVFRAIRDSHDESFDWLALFAFNLSHIGNPQSGVPARPSLWANEFVRSKLWSNGRWHREALDLAAMRASISPSIIGVKDTKAKVISNYRSLFNHLGLTKFSSSELNTRALDWVGSAVFLTWDRISNHSDNAGKLKSIVVREALHKLIGVEEDWLKERVDDFAAAYIDAGGINRVSSTTTLPSLSNKKIPSAEILFDVATDGEVRRIERIIAQQVRNRSIATQLKILYDNQCCFCGVRLRIAPEKYGSHAAHIRQLGRPGDGPDTASNMIVLCPNHHIEFDAGGLRLSKIDSGWKIVCSDPDHELEGREISFKHDVNADHIEWHRSYFESSYSAASVDEL